MDMKIGGGGLASPILLLLLCCSLNLPSPNVVDVAAPLDLTLLQVN
jgi:hypothetical protein